MTQKKVDSGPQREGAEFDRRFRRAIVGFAVVEFIVIALVIYHKLAG